MTKTLLKKSQLLVLLLTLAVSVAMSLAPPAFAAGLSSAQQKQRATQDCKGASDKTACIDAWINGYNGQSGQSYCTNAGANMSNCQAWLDMGTKAAGNTPAASVVPPSSTATTSNFPPQCQGWQTNAELNACKKGVDAKTANKSNPCGSLKDTGSSKLKTACEDAFKNTTAGASSSTAPGAAASCDESGFVLSWIMCPVIGGLADLINGLYKDIIFPLLNIDSAQILDTSKGFYQVWSNFRIYGDIFLVIALLVIVFGESIGGGMIEAYTAKKVLPRLLAAAILINISIYLVVLGVDISNILGHGIYSLIVAPFSQVKAAGGFGLHVNFGGEALTAAAVTGGAFWAAAMAGGSIAGGLLHFLLTSILLPAALVMIAILLTLLIRTALIYLLIFVSPVAFALYTVPNTEQYFKKWWDMFFRTLLIFPIVAAIFAIANVTAYTLSNTGGVFGQLLGLAALFAPPILVPFAFRFAGGIMGQVHQGIQQRVAQPGLDGLKKYRAGKRQEAFQRIPENRFFKNNPTGLRGGINRGLATGSVLASGRADWSRQGLKDSIQVGKSLKKAEKAAEILKDGEFGDVLANDSADRTIHELRKNNKGLDDTGAAVEFLTRSKELGGEGMDDASATQLAQRIRMMSIKYDQDAIHEASSVAESGTKTGFAGGYDEMAERINEVAGDDRAQAVRMMAQMRDRAGQAGRGDLAPSFGTSIDVLETLNAAQKANAGASRTNKVQLQLPDENGVLRGQVDDAGNAVMLSEYDANMHQVRMDTRAKINTSNLQTKGPSSFWQGHGNQTKNMTIALKDSILHTETGLQQANKAQQAAYDSGNEAEFQAASKVVQQAERSLAQKYAEVDAIFEAASYSGTPEATKFFADTVMNARVKVGGVEVPVSERRKVVQGTTAYQQTHRTYGAVAEEDFSHMTQAERERAEAEARRKEQGQ